jgi:hypothetical protein
MTTSRRLILLIAFLVFSGCEEFFIKPIPNDPVENFEQFWQAFDKNYSFFDIKGVDWDGIYTHYRSQIDPSTSEKKLFDIFNEITQLLKDGHVNVYTQYGSTKYNFTQGYPVNSSDYATNYLMKVAKVNSSVSYGFIKDSNLGYLSIRSFGGDVNNCCQFDAALEAMKNTDALIIDVRSNGGGNDLTALSLASRLIEEKTQYSWVRYRNGKAHNDFTEWVPNYVTPDGNIKYLKPIAVLTNRGCFSSCEAFIMMMQANPRAITIGGVSGGGSGNPIGRELPNGWTFRVPIWQQADINKELFELKGLTPDYVTTISDDDIKQMRDTILEKAIELLR